jgi:homocysteine S-methyltransferase
MPKYRRALPQTNDQLFLTDSGLETTLVFLDGRELPCFAAFDLLREPEGRARLKRYFDIHAELAVKSGAGLVLESPTWRASPDWGRQIGWSLEALAEANRDSILLLEQVRAEWERPGAAMPISGCVGPRGDGYRPDDHMTVEEAKAYHAWQVGVFAQTEADLVTAITMTYPQEAIGVARAAAAASLPCVISFTVETDGRLPSGHTLAEAVAMTDAATGGSVAYYMVNCAHPDHFDGALSGDWTRRVRGVRANASRRSHAELDNATELDAGDPRELGRQYAELRRRLPHLTVLGGCCGTDDRHIAEIAAACAPAMAA